jgi:predicted Zn-dependent peptidase
MESQRLMRPAFREFYAARDKLVAERGRSSEGVQGLFQALAAAAFEAHPYRNPTFGWPGDVGRLRRTDARQFLDKYYVPSNVTIAIVGDVNPAEARKLADKYFAPWPAKPWAGPVRTQEPPQMGPKSVVLEARPVMGRPIPTAMALVGYKRPSQYDQDDAAFDILQIALGQGRTGVLSQELVTDKRVLQNLQIRATFPAGRYPNLFVFALVPAQGRTVEDAQKSLEEFLNRLKSQKIQATIIERAKALAHVAAINRLTGNAGIAGMLGVYQANYGDWRKLFTAIDDFEKVTADDLQRVMVKYFVPAGRTTAYTVMAGLPVVAPGGGDQ